MRQKHWFLVFFIFAGLLYTGCSSFIPDEEINRVKLKYQAGDYLLLQDIERNGTTLVKGTIVKLTVVPGDEWIKFYVYDTKEQLLSSNRLILLYLFEDDFSEKEYNREVVESELAKLVKPVDLNDLPRQETKKSVKKVKK